MTLSMQSVVARIVTVIRGFRGRAQNAPGTRWPIARQALPLLLRRRLRNRGVAPVFLRRIDGVDGLTILCNSLEG